GKRTQRRTYVGKNATHSKERNSKQSQIAMDQNLKLTEGYRAWSAFVNEFRDIQSALLESKDAEGRLIRRCDRLKSELVSSGNKLQLAIKVR
ncbi:unnamed protein product, partial [Discosporangium mesarthrocarpum]